MMVIQSSGAQPQSIRRIEWSTAGEVLGGGAAAFTPWLSRNLDVIRDALGIDELDLVATEVDVAGKRLDILAAASEGPDGTQLAVAIEAQYGVSNHDHLGKLLTYTAGAEATADRVLAVWVVDQVHPAHLAAVEMLNRQTSERLGFVLMRIRFAGSPANGGRTTSTWSRSRTSSSRRPSGRCRQRRTQDGTASWPQSWTRCESSSSQQASNTYRWRPVLGVTATRA